MDAEVEQAVRAGIETLRELGAELVDVSLPHTRYAVATYYILANAEASSNLARYDGVRYGVRTTPATNLLDMYRHTRAEGFDAYYKKAQQLRTLFRQDFHQAFTQCEALLAPVSPTAAFHLGERLDDPLQMYLADVFTIPVNLAGLPAMSIPCGLTRQQLPIGLQVIAPPFRETTLLQVAAAFEVATDFHTYKPPLSLGCDA
jgi:aspartyl-tRNA(Asn)/glutamyl-tRNA(Gln) amidotransferase subunit A